MIDFLDITKNGYIPIMVQVKYLYIEQGVINKVNITEYNIFGTTLNYRIVNSGSLDALCTPEFCILYKKI